LGIPHKDVKWVSIPVFLQHQDTRPFLIIRIVFHHSSIIDAFDNITRMNIVGHKLIVAMLGNSN
jgi:hypothetical protein